MPPGKITPPRSNPAPKVNMSQGVMGSKGPTMVPKVVMGSKYYTSSTPAKTNTSKNTTTANQSKYDKSISSTYQSAAYGDYLATTKVQQSAVQTSAGSAPISVASTPTTAIRLPETDNKFTLDSRNVDEATIVAMVFEKLGAVELTKFTRTDTVEGINPYYNIISNLSAIKKEFDPSNLVSSQKSDDSLYNAFSIKLSNKIPGDKYLEDRNLDNYIYIDVDGNLIIELDNMTSDELVEIEIDTNGTIVEVR
jgi:hypothetical protein